MFRWEDKIMKKGNLFKSKEAKKLWKEVDDAILVSRTLSEIYDNVPKEISAVRIDVLEFHLINSNPKLKKKVINWLNKQ